MFSGQVSLLISVLPKNRLHWYVARCAICHKLQSALCIDSYHESMTRSIGIRLHESLHLADKAMGGISQGRSWFPLPCFFGSPAAAEPRRVEI